METIYITYKCFLRGQIPGGGVLPCKGLMGTCGQPGYVFRHFCLKQGIEFIIFCLNQGIGLSIFVLTGYLFVDDEQQNFVSSCLLILTSVDFGIDTRHIKFPLITQPKSHTTSCNRNFQVS